jgi:hypothetical protein
MSWHIKEIIEATCTVQQWKKVTALSSRITKLGVDILSLKATVLCKTEPHYCVSCKIDDLWVFPLFKKWGAICV